MPVLKPCAHCRTLIPVGTTLCPRCAHSDNQRRATKAKAYGYHTTVWQQKRQTILAHHPVCQYCNNRPATTVHLDPAWHGDHVNAPLDALTALCSSCHGTVDAPRSKQGGVSHADVL